MKQLRETVLITGASSGIGWELAKRFAADGSSLILVARRTDKLQELADQLQASHGTVSQVIGADLSQADASERLMQEIAARGCQIDILVNNAGFGQLGRFENIPLERHTNMLQLNIAALVELTYRVLPQMRERKAGSVLNIGSTASFQPGPNCAVYYATKAFVLSFSEALWKELQGTGVTVSCLCPGPTKTGFGPDSAMDQTAVFKYNSMDVGAVAEAGFQAIRRKRRMVIPGFINNLLAGSVRLTPRGAILNVMSLLQSTGGAEKK